MAIITVPGGSDSSIAVTVDGSQALALANQIRDDIVSHYYKTDRDIDVTNFYNGDDISPLAPRSNLLFDGVIKNGGVYNVKDGVNFITVGTLIKDGQKLDANDKFDANNFSFLNEPVTVNSAMSANQYIRVLAGIDGQVTYKAGKESGQFAGGSKDHPINFIGNDQEGGRWQIATGDGDDTIASGSGNNVINAGAGKNKITLGTGNNQVTSDGQDTITAPNGGFNSITIRGGHSLINIGDNSLINDVSSNNVITVGGGSTVIGGNAGNVTFNAASNDGHNNNHNRNEFLGGQNNTITASTDNFDVIHGVNNTFNINGSFKFFNGTGNTNVTLTGGQNITTQTQIFGADGLNFHLTAKDVNDPNNPVLLVAGGGGNQTLDGSTSSSNLLIYSDSTKGATTQLLGVGGAGNDTLVGGVGSNTLTGGEGNNLFIFTKDTDQGGKTLITDFSKSKNNMVEFLNYGFNRSDVDRILQNAHQDDKGNAVLDLGNHQLILQGVSVKDLNGTQFTYINDPVKK